MNAFWHTIITACSLADITQLFSWENEKGILIEIIMKDGQKWGRTLLVKK